MSHRLLLSSIRSAYKINRSALKSSISKPRQFHQSLIMKRDISADRISHSFAPVDNGPNVKELIVRVTFIDWEGKRKEVKGRIGQTIYDVAVENDIKLNGSNPKKRDCGGVLSCSECHVVLPELWYFKLPQVSEFENHKMDHLQLTQKLKSTSRLACQITLEKELDGIVIALVGDDVDWNKMHFSFY